MHPFTDLGVGFRHEAEKYAAYLDTPKGRLRLDLALAGVEEFLQPLPSSKPLRALDVGGGTGAAAVKLARRGLEVTLLDSSAAMLEIAERTVQQAQLGDKVRLRQGDAGQVGQLFHGESFDVVLCHNVLEYVEQPETVMRGCAQLMRRDPCTLMSILVRNRAGEVLKTAIEEGDLDAAQKALTADWGSESLYGGQVGLFTPDKLLAITHAAGLEVIARRGVRVVADYLPPRLSLEADYDRVFELELDLGRHPEFAAIARYTHAIVRHTPGPGRTLHE